MADDESTGTVVVALPAATDPVNGIGDEQKHATLVFLGDDVAQADVDAVRAAVAGYVAVGVEDGTLGPFPEKVTGIESLGDKGARVWMIDSDDGLEGLHDDLAALPTIADLMGRTEQFPSYTPHVTIAYPPEGSTDLDEATETAAAAVDSITFDRIAVWSGTEQTEYPLTDVAEGFRVSFLALPEAQQIQLVEASGLDVDEVITSAKGAEGTERLMTYWAEGEGAAKIRWGTPDDFYRCVSHLGKYVADAKGLCANLHHRATGAWPGHAPGESTHESHQEAAVTDLQVLETVTISEAAAKDAQSTGRFLMQFISPGWGSSGYYSPDTLREAALDRVIPAGTHMYADHPTDAEHKARPGRSIKDLMAVTTEDARLSESGALVGEVKVVPAWRDFVETVRDHIGASIRGDAKDVREGTAEGRRGRIIDGLAHVQSVDFVTRAGRGGKVLELLESAVTEGVDIRDELAQAVREDDPTHVPATRPDGKSTTESQEEIQMGTKQIEESEFTRLTEAAGRVDTLEAELTEVKAQLAEATKPEEPGPVVTGPRKVVQEHIVAQDDRIARLEAREGARAVIGEVLAEAWIGDTQKARLTSALMESLPMKEGKLDEDVLRQTTTDRVNEAETETAEILKSAGVGSPRGLGALSTPATEAAIESIQSELIESFKERGLSEAAATAAVKGR